MRLIVEIGHPGHVHLFRNAIAQLRARGHAVYIVARDKDVTRQLLLDYGLDAAFISRQSRGILGLGAEMLVRDWRLLRIALDFRPDVFMSVSMCSTHVATLLGKISILFDDSEHASLERATWLPFATIVCTPAAYNMSLGRKQRRYPGYHELAYLHPQRFTPDRAVLQEIGLQESDRFFLVRFVSWQATHDIDQHGFSADGKHRLITELSRHGRVIVTSESPLPPELESFRFKISPTKIHSVLYYSTLYIGEGATMASEAAMLGTPSLYVNTLSAGTLEEQEKKYGLLQHIPDEQRAIAAALQLATDPGAHDLYRQRRAAMLADRIDVTDWMVALVEEQYDRRR